jgi:hypothetical protein
MENTYVVKSVEVSGCCSKNVKPKDIEKECESMASNGYKLVLSYEAQVGCCCCAQKASVLFFEKK